MSLRPETIQLEENIGCKLLDFGLSGDFFVLDNKGKGIKSKNKQVGLYQTKKLGHSKGNHQQYEKATYGMGENVCKSYIW